MLIENKTRETDQPEIRSWNKIRNGRFAEIVHVDQKQNQGIKSIRNPNIKQWEGDRSRNPTKHTRASFLWPRSSHDDALLCTRRWMQQAGGIHTSLVGGCMIMVPTLTVWFLKFGISQWEFQIPRMLEICRCAGSRNPSPNSTRDVPGNVNREGMSKVVVGGAKTTNLWLW